MNTVKNLVSELNFETMFTNIVHKYDLRIIHNLCVGSLNEKKMIDRRRGLSYKKVLVSHLKLWK